MVRADVAPESRVDFVFGSMLQSLQASFKRNGRGRVSDARAYVKGVCEAMGWHPTLPVAAQDREFPDPP